MLGGTMRASQRDSPPRLRYSFRSQKAIDVVKTRTQLTTTECKWVFPLVASTMVAIVLLVLATLSVGSAERHSIVPVLPARAAGRSQMALEIIAEDPATELPPPPKLAYLISGTRGDGERMRRTLQALYHPRNYYLLHLDLEAPMKERVDLARYVKNEVVFKQNENVFVVGRANLVTYRGPTMIAATLHGAAILLRQAKDWDWFINLSAADYPLVTQDGTSFVCEHLKLSFESPTR